MVKDLEWAASHSNAQRKRPQTLAECQGDDDDTCSQRKKSGFVSDEEWKKCHSGAQTAAHGDDEYCGKKSGLITDEEWKKCHSSAQKEQKTEAPAAKAADQKKVEAQRAQQPKGPTGSKSDPICSSSGWCGEPWAWSKEEKAKIVQYPVGLPLDKDIRDTQTHLKDQEAEKGTWNMDKDPSKYKKQKAEPKKEKKEKKDKKEIKEKTKLQTEADERSDPPFNSDDGYETRYMNPSDDKDIVKYKTDNALDSDVIATQKHFKQQEKEQSHNFDPVKFLAQTKEIDNGEPQSLSDMAPQTSYPNAIV